MLTEVSQMVPTVPKKIPIHQLYTAGRADGHEGLPECFRGLHHWCQAEGSHLLSQNQVCIQHNKKATRG